jgi:erythromycin esterase-like protein
MLALGEPTHGEDILLEVRNDLFRQLVEQEGYRSIVIESDCIMGLVVDDYVTSGTGTLDEAVERGFSHGWGASAANRELVRWMRAYNEERPASEHVRFAGFDGPLEMTHAASPRQVLTALHGHLASRVGADLLPCIADTLDRLLGDDARWTNPAAMMDPSQSVGQSAGARELRLLADDLAALLDAQPRLRPTGPRAPGRDRRDHVHQRRTPALDSAAPGPAEPGTTRRAQRARPRTWWTSSRRGPWSWASPTVVRSPSMSISYRNWSGIRPGGGTVLRSTRWTSFVSMGSLALSD